MKKAWRAAVLTVSDKGAAGLREDLSGPMVREWLLGAMECEMADYRVVPDERAQIAAVLREWADERRFDLVLTTGGTGLAPRDVTPEATRDVIEREVPGLSELMRQAGMKFTLRAALSRGICGIRGRTLIVNLPGSVKGARESLLAIADLLPHALDVLRERETDHE